MKNRKFSEEYKKEAVRLVLEQGIPRSQACIDLGIGRSTLEKWLSAYRAAEQPETITEDERSELKRLRKENIILKMERDILKKATAYFAREVL